VAVGVGLIVVAVALTVAWQILAAPESVGSQAVGPARAIAYFFGSLLFLLLIAGLVLIVILLLREVRLNERQSNFVSADPSRRTAAWWYPYDDEYARMMAVTGRALHARSFLVRVANQLRLLTFPRFWRRASLGAILRNLDSLF
jgi:hypothetical protein